MGTMIRATGAATVALLLGVGVVAVCGQDSTAKAAASLAPCDTCHDTLAAAFAKNPHARGALAAKGLDTTVCASCHGDGSKHVQEGDKALISVPKGDAGAKLCLGCHGGSRNKHDSRTGPHANASVSCPSCHSIHEAKAEPLLRVAGSALCISCHPAQKALFAKPFAHRLDVGGLTCASCHNPHGGRGENSLRQTSAGEVACFDCHSDKRGPFVFSHTSESARSCQACHEPHGSNNSKMLSRGSVDQLCLECHTGFPRGTLGPQPPSIHDLRSPRYRNCTTCHVAVHGSNSSPLLLK
jgi:DmsE family decaheme c-type cytochrome